MVTPALAEKLDADEVNGPQDDLDWDAIYWWPVEDDVRRLRRRIFKASQDGNLKRVRNLQKLMLRSRSNTLVSVRRVTQHNAGRTTAGIDGEVALTSRDRAALTVDLHRHSTPWRPDRSSGSTSPKRTESSGHWGFRCWPTGCNRPGSSTRWNLSGRGGSSRVRTGSGQDAAVMTRSRRSTGRSRAGAPSANGCSTRTCRRRSTASTTIGCWTISAPFPPREWSPGGWPLA